MTIYPKSCREIMTEWLQSRLGPEDTIRRDEMLQHMAKNWPKIKRTTVSAHITKLTTNHPSRVHYGAGPDHDVLYRLPSGLYRLYRPQEDPPPIYERAAKPEVEPEGPEKEEGEEFPYERDLRNFLARHLELLEPGLKLYEEEEIEGIEYPAGSRRIDILAQDAAGQYVVIEVKVSRGHERTVGQLAYYLSWVRENMADGRPVRGIIVARDVSEELKMALLILPNVTIYRYQLNVTLTKEE